VSCASSPISAMRRRMKARINISLSSGSRCTRVRKSSRSTAMTVPVYRDARADQAAAAPRSMLISPVNWPGCVDGEGSSDHRPGSYNIDRARDHHEEARVLIADVEQDLSRTYSRPFSDASDPVNLAGVSLGNLCAARSISVIAMGFPSTGVKSRVSTSAGGQALASHVKSDSTMSKPQTTVRDLPLLPQTRRTAPALNPSRGIAVPRPPLALGSCHGVYPRLFSSGVHQNGSRPALVTHRMAASAFAKGFAARRD